MLKSQKPSSIFIFVFLFRWLLSILRGVNCIFRPRWQSLKCHVHLDVWLTFLSWKCDNLRFNRKIVVCVSGNENFLSLPVLVEFVFEAKKKFSRNLFHWRSWKWFFFLQQSWRNFFKWDFRGKHVFHQSSNDSDV